MKTLIFYVGDAAEAEKLADELRGQGQTAHVRDATKHVASEREHCDQVRILSGVLGAAAESIRQTYGDRVAGDEPVAEDSSQELASAPEQSEEETVSRDDLETHTKAELKEFAESHHVDLHGARTKSEIVDAILGEDQT